MSKFLRFMMSFFLCAAVIGIYGCGPGVGERAAIPSGGEAIKGVADSLRSAVKGKPTVESLTIAMEGVNASASHYNTAEINTAKEKADTLIAAMKTKDSAKTKAAQEDLLAYLNQVSPAGG